MASTVSLDQRQAVPLVAMLHMGWPEATTPRGAGIAPAGFRHPIRMGVLDTRRGADAPPNPNTDGSASDQDERPVSHGASRDIGTISNLSPSLSAGP
jgi:hypothetical protein